jgi:hypothetical protein
MILNSFMLESMMLERQYQLQRLAKQERLLAGLPHHKRLRYLMRCLSTLFFAIRTYMQQLVLPDQSADYNGMQDETFPMKGLAMNTQIQAEEQLVIAPSLEIDATAGDGLAQRGFTAEEIATLLWLKRWYQSGGSDRMELVRHWEFLKFLVLHDRLEV